MQYLLTQKEFDELKNKPQVDEIKWQLQEAWLLLTTLTKKPTFQCSLLLEEYTCDGCELDKLDLICVRRRRYEETREIE